MFSVHQHWDPLKVCIVGQSYPPEFYSWITVSHVRSLFEKIAIETEEDYQHIIKKLESFGVDILRPDLPSVPFIQGSFQPPPMCPRDHTVMIGNNFYTDNLTMDAKLKKFYLNVKDSTWPNCNTVDDFLKLPDYIQTECKTVHKIDDNVFHHPSPYKKIVEFVKQQGNNVKTVDNYNINGAMVSRIGKDLYFGTESHDQDQDDYKTYISQEFPNYRNHIINTKGHSDGTYCPVTPGLIISLKDVPTYKDTFPDWEVVYLPGQSWAKVAPFLKLKEQNKGKWWIPGFEHNQDVIDTVEQWLGHWTGYVEETVFDVNMLIVDPKNVLVFNYNKTVFDAFARYGITPHIVPFRHRYFWDGGIHCVTSDLHRDGMRQNFFPQRG
jgi:hypothetical protein